MSTSQIDPGQRERRRRPDYGTLIAVGLGGGAALGAAFGAVDRGALVGLLGATILNAYFEWRAGAAGGAAALAISAAGAVVVLIILLVT